MAIGKAARRVFLTPGLEVVTTKSADEEAFEYLPRLSEKHGLDLSEVEKAFALLSNEICDESRCRRRLAAARRLVGEDDADDVALAAVALALKVPIWTNDADFGDAELKVFATAQLLERFGLGVAGLSP